MTSLFVGNLSKNINRAKLQEVFSEIGSCIVDFKTNKGPYAFVEYNYSDDALKAMKKLNNTTLNGANGNNPVRIEVSHKKKVKDENGSQVLVEDSKNEELILQEYKKSGVKSYNNRDNHDYEDKFKGSRNRISSPFDRRSRSRDRDDSENSNNRGKRFRIKPDGTRVKMLPLHMKNICFVCKLPGHLAKDCILTRDMCFECGEKGHLAKECKEKVRKAKELTYNRVKAIRSQQSEFKFINAGARIENLLNFFIQENNTGI